MSHNTLKNNYRLLADRLNRFPQGAAPTALLFEILKLLMNDQEAGLLSLLPIKPFTVETASRAWKLPLVETQKMLDGLASRAILLDGEENGKTWYTLPPPMAGFFEFSMMRYRDDLDQKIGRTIQPVRGRR